MKIKSLIQIIISILLIAFIIYNVGPEKIWHQFSHMDFFLTLFAIILDGVGVALSSKKWQILLQSKEIHIPFLRIWKHYYIGVFFNAFLPTSIGGDAIKAYNLSKELDKKIEAVSSVVMERLTGLIAIVSIGALAILLGNNLLPLNVLLITIFVIIPGPVILMIFIFKTTVVEKIIQRRFFSRFPKIKQMATNAYCSLKEYSERKKFLYISLFISFTYHTLLISINYVLALSLGLNIDIFYFFIFVPVAEILILLPITIQGFGIRSAAYVSLFSQIGVPSAGAFALGFSMEIVKLIGNALGGIVYLCSNVRNLHGRENNEDRFNGDN